MQFSNDVPPQKRFVTKTHGRTGKAQMVQVSEAEYQQLQRAARHSQRSPQPAKAKPQMMNDPITGLSQEELAEAALKLTGSDLTDFIVYNADRVRRGKQ